MLKKMTKEELELLSHTDLAYEILKENKKPLNTPQIFKKICNMLEMTDDEYTNKIGEFYTHLNTDKRFVLLDGVKWDIRDKHAVEIELDEEDEDAEEVIEEIEEEAEEEEDNIPVDDDDDDDDDMMDLTIISDNLEEELEDN